MPKIDEIVDTPNPNAKKFIIKEPLTYGLVRAYDHADQATGDALAQALFAVPHVVNVYYVDRWLTITQDGAADWHDLLKKVAEPIRAAAAPSAQDPVMEPAFVPEVSEEDKPRLERIETLLDEHIRPALGMDGGGLQVVGLNEDQLMIHYQGACGSCPSSFAGTLQAIQNLVRTIEPELYVVAV